MPLQNRIALITGAAQGIGLATAKSLLQAGNRVVVTDRVFQNTELFSAEEQTRVMLCTLDVTQTEQAAEVFTKIKQDWGPVNILVNNAGISMKQADGTSTLATNVSNEEWEKTFAINLTSILRLTQLAIPHMKETGWGRIINIASLAGRTRSRVSGAAYSSAKAGVLGITRTMANELGPFGITANSVAPGRVATLMAMQGSADINTSYAAEIPVRRLGTPEEVAAVIVFLAAELSGFINGAIIDINGGYFMP